MANSKTNNKKKTTSSKSAAKKNTTKTTSTKTTTKTASKNTTAKKTNVKAENKKTAPKTTNVKVENKKNNTKKEAAKTNVAKKQKREKINVIDWCKENYMIIGLVLLAILLIINIVMVSMGHKVQLSNGKEIIATVDGKQFLAEDLFDKLKESYGSDTLLNMVDEYIVSKEISDDEKVEAKKSAQENIDSIKEQYESAGYKWEDVLSQYGYANEDALIDEMTLSVEKETVAKNYIKKDITDEDIKKYYEENVFGKYTAKHILITADTNDDMSDEEKEAAEAKAKETAEEVISRLNDDEDWKDLVAEYSEDTGSKDNEGLIEDFTKGDVVDEFWDAVEKLKDGEYTKEPVKSSYGYHVIYRVSYTDKKALKDMKDELVDEIVANKLNEDSELYTTTWANIRKKYNLEIKDSIIKSKYETKTKESE